MTVADVMPREGGRREELVDVDLMEKLRQGGLDLCV